MGALGRASGKLILFGEHAAVYGHPAVGIALAEQTTVRLEDVRFPEWVLENLPGADRAVVAELFTRMWQMVRGDRLKHGYSVNIASTVPRGVGFGSSAALCVAIARSLVLLAEDRVGEASPERVWPVAHEGEHLFHGTPSGIDTGISLIGGTVILRPQPPQLPKFERVHGNAVQLVTGAVRRVEGCAAQISAIASRIRSGDKNTKSCIDELGAISADAALRLESLEGEPANDLGKLADSAMARLRRLGLSTPDLEAVLDFAHHAGALGSKLSGAGGGGAFYSIASDRESALFIADRIESAARAKGIELVGGIRVVQT